MNSQKLSGRKIPDREVAERYGVVARTLRRWEENPELGFPKALLINRRKYRDEDELIAWERARATQAA